MAASRDLRMGVFETSLYSCIERFVDGCIWSTILFAKALVLSALIKMCMQKRRINCKREYLCLRRLMRLRGKGLQRGMPMVLEVTFCIYSDKMDTFELSLLRLMVTIKAMHSLGHILVSITKMVVHSHNDNV